MGLTVYQSDTSTGWQRLAQAPHRAYFAAGVLSLLAMALWWLISLQLAPGSHAYPVVMVHALMMPLGVFPLFMLGFIFTAGPKWLNLPASTRHFPMAIGYLSGVLLALIGFAHGGSWPVIGLLVMQLVWAIATLRWLGCLRSSSEADRFHPSRLLAAMLLGTLVIMLAVLWVRSGDGRLWIQARDAALWGMLLPIFLTVSHRMLPFFTQSALPGAAIWRPRFLLDGWLAACALLVLSGLLDSPRLTGCVTLALSLSLAFTSWRWWQRGVMTNHLLAMLHLSFAWLAPALLLQALSVFGWPVGAAPAHALALGFCCTMLVGFVTRVTLGHGGRQLVADSGYWAIYLAMHGVAALRVVIALLGLSASWINVVSLLWLAVMIAWATRILPIYWQARQDGKPG
ncbi:NnrS family protein [Chitinimonas sp.]|uniref:NnrS family protein n=1 Tax=Chitinimonas sp. TaxID=1934313 RepID=UPI0035B0BB4F